MVQLSSPWITFVLVSSCFFVEAGKSKSPLDLNALHSYSLSPCTTTAPLGRRQIGDVQCNVARLKTVAGLAATTKAVNTLSASAGK